MTDETPIKIPDVQQSPQPSQQARGPWKQIAIVLVSAIILAGSSCAAMIGTLGNHEQLFNIFTVAFAIGLVGIPIALVWTIIALIEKFARK
jgi:hypothetical protein